MGIILSSVSGLRLLPRDAPVRVKTTAAQTCFCLSIHFGHNIHKGCAARASTQALLH